ncbi:MAG: hypothetical protein MJ086_06230 [Lachnospiraceae bacterium]|nr:hypothetical protein [Lachnospiraceae bacterium]
MIRFVKEEEVPELLSFLKEDVENCIYLYTDVFTYGLENPNMKVWVEDRDGEYKCVIMKYHDSYQLYSRNEDWDVDGVIGILNEYPATVINGKKDMIERLYPYYQDSYRTIFGAVMRLNSVLDFPEMEYCEMATLDDVDEIAQIIVEDVYYKDYYTKEELAKQLRERMTTGMGRSAIIRRDGKIVAHVASFTEADGIAVSSGTIAKVEYRGHKYGIAVESYLNKVMNSLGYKWFGFILEQDRIELFERLGNKTVALYGKLVKLAD